MFEVERKMKHDMQNMRRIYSMRTHTNKGKEKKEKKRV